MIFQILFIFLLTVALLVEISIIPFPFVFMFSVLYFFYSRKLITIFIILFFSMLLDRAQLHTLGVSSFFFFFFFCIVTVLEKSFSIKATSLFAAFAVLISVEIYRNYVGYPFLPAFEVLLILFLVALIMLERFINKKEGSLYDKEI
ncbi:MAG: hypothetical protein KBC00_02525 [Candidatus Levybacteria bacterium]|nr:hypothetical protein [Candidatus Levybacteria bacterium]MBP9815005.1 hypothetical protein [Candidatus Levybacteria bacterium]